MSPIMFSRIVAQIAQKYGNNSEVVYLETKFVRNGLEFQIVIEDANGVQHRETIVV